MRSLFSILATLLASAFIYNLIETICFDFFSKFLFRFGIPAYFKTIDSVKIPSDLFNDRIVETNEGKFKFSKNCRLYFRSHGLKSNGRQYEAFPIRVTGSITESGNLNIVGRIPFPATIILICFNVFSFAALIRDGISPAIIFLIGIWLLFGYSYRTEKRRIKNMILELHQIIGES